jgi:CRISPR-associated protein Cas4
MVVDSMGIEMVTEVDVYRWIMDALKDVDAKAFPKDVISVTEACSPCLRKAYFDRVKSPIPSPIDFVKLVGEEAHSRILDVLRKRGYSIEVPFSLKIRDMTLVGRVDAAKEEGGNKHIVEFKVVDDIPDKPYESHEMQVQLYMLAMRIPVAYIVYISRRDGRVRVYRVRYDKKMVREAVKRAYRLFLALRDNKAPPPERSPICNYCPYALSCLSK